MENIRKISGRVPITNERFRNPKTELRFRWTKTVDYPRRGEAPTSKAFSKTAFSKQRCSISTHEFTQVPESPRLFTLPEMGIIDAGD